MKDTIEAVTERLQKFANNHKLILELEGKCGFGRECVGLNVGNNWLDFNPISMSSYERLKELYDEKLLLPDGVENYHKHDCFAVIGRGETAIRQLDKWIQHITSQGDVEVVQYETGATGIQAIVTGLFGKALRFKK